jgi:hypothetical protein
MVMYLLSYGQFGLLADGLVLYSFSRLGSTDLWLMPGYPPLGPGSDAVLYLHNSNVSLVPRCSYIIQGKSEAIPACERRGLSESDPQKSAGAFRAFPPACDRTGKVFFL